MFTQEFKQDAVQMLFDGHTTSSVAQRLGVGTNVHYRWKSQQIEDSGPAASALESRVRELEAGLRRVERERDILKKALASGCPEMLVQPYFPMERSLNIAKLR